MIFFFEWLKIAEEGAREEYTPNWSKIVDMKNTSFPRFAFRYEAGKQQRPAKFHVMPRNAKLLPNYKFPNRGNVKRNMRKMKSFVPPIISMMVFDSPTGENRILQQYVDNYVRKFSF